MFSILAISRSSFHLTNLKFFIFIMTLKLVLVFCSKSKKLFYALKIATFDACKYALDQPIRSKPELVCDIASVTSFSAI